MNRYFDDDKRSRRRRHADDAADDDATRKITPARRRRCARVTPLRAMSDLLLSLTIMIPFIMIFITRAAATPPRQRRRHTRAALRHYALPLYALLLFIIDTPFLPLLMN